MIKTSKHIGNIGDKIEITVLIEKVLAFDSMYGTTHMHIMSDNEGNDYVWYSSSQTLETGKEVVLKGTVKAHKDHKGIKQTILTRCSEIVLKKYVVVLEKKVYEVLAESEKDASKKLKIQLGLTRMPRGVKFIEATE